MQQNLSRNTAARTCRIHTPVARCCFAFCLLAASTFAAAQNVTCESGPDFTAFDFWVGEWRVYNNATGTLAGTNSIRKLEQGCLLQESWEGAGGSTGTSINYYNPVQGVWRQVWVSAGLYAIDIQGGLVEGAMVLTGTIDTYNGMSAHFRGTWTANPDGTVRQLFEQQNSQTQAWEVWFDGRYERVQSN